MDMGFLKPFSQAFKKQAEGAGVSGKGRERFFLMASAQAVAGVFAACFWFVDLLRQCVGF